MRTISDEPLDDERQRQPSKQALRDMLKRAVVNTGGVVVDGKPLRKAAPATSPTPAAPPTAEAKPLPAAPAVPRAPEPARRKHEDLKVAGDLRRIDASKLTPVKPESEIGERPKLYWLPLTRLYVDDRYQRNVLATGLANVYRIAREFEWRKFSPVIAAQVDDLYAVVDGQHRCYAAALRGIDEVPCLIIHATLAEQAAAFAAINGRTTRISELHVHAAAVTAGDPAAIALADLCRACGVEICRYPVPENKMTAGQTLAVGTLRQCLGMYGEAALGLALRCIVAAHPNTAGVLRAPLIRAMSEMAGGLNGERKRAAVVTARNVDFVKLTAAAKLRAAGNARAVRVELFEALCAIFDPPTKRGEVPR